MTSVRERFRRLLEGLDTRSGAAWGLVALCAFHFLVSGFWLLLDNHVIRIDEQFHAEGAQRIYYLMSSDAYGSWGERIAAFREAPSPYPPLVHLIGALLVFILGYSVDVIALGGVLSFLAMLVGVYWLVQPMMGRRGALLAATVSSFIPILFAGSRYIVLENVVMALCTWALVALVRSDYFRRTPWTLAFGVFNGLAILAKPTAFAYYLVPSAALFFAGLVWAWRARDGQSWRILLHGVMVLVVSAAIALPWYLDNMRYLESYWMGEHKRGQTPFTFSEPVEPQANAMRAAPRAPQALDAITDVPESEAIAAPAADLPNTPALRTATDAMGTLQEGEWEEAPGVAGALRQDGDGAEKRPWRFVSTWNWLADREWLAYPIAVVNNASFLPLTLLAIFGLVLMPVSARYRRREYVVLLLWLLGAYLCMTLFFRYINPRYTMPLAPSLGIGAAGLLLLIPGAWLRPRLIGCVLVLLLVQFFHISFGPVNKGDVWLPYLQDKFRVQYYRDQGITVYKSKVTAGTYTFRAPERGVNYVERAFYSMVNAERGAGSTPGADRAYGVVQRQNNFGGFTFLEKRFWPEPNPLLLPELRGMPEGQYRFQQQLIINGRAEIDERINDMDYLVVTLQDTEAVRTVGPYHHYGVGIMQRAPFELIDYFYAPAYGLLPPAQVSVLRRRDLASLQFSLENIFYGPAEVDFQRMTPETARAVRDHMTEVLEGVAEPVALNASIAHCFTSMRRISESLVQIRSVFKCTQTIERDFSVAFEIIPQSTGIVGIHPIKPMTPTSSWSPDQYYFVDRFVEIEAGEYALGVYFFDAMSPFGTKANIGIAAI